MFMENENENAKVHIYYKITETFENQYYFDEKSRDATILFLLQ